MNAHTATRQQPSRKNGNCPCFPQPLGRTDIDVILTPAVSGPPLIFIQAKTTRAAMKSIAKQQEWMQKAVSKAAQDGETVVKLVFTASDKTVSEFMNLPIGQALDDWADTLTFRYGIDVSFEYRQVLNP